MAPVGELLRRPERTHSIDFLTVAIFRQLKFFSLAREADEPGPKHLRCELFCPRRHARHAVSCGSPNLFLPQMVPMYGAANALMQEINAHHASMHKCERV
jgi:hypothetical protein